jgi:predicted ATP-grasp superfamily ATP-dependent carboligase
VTTAPKGRVLVTDAEERAALGAIRALRAAGYLPTAAAFSTPAAGHFSRAAAARLVLPDPRSASREFAEALRSALERDPHDVLLPGSDAALLAISEHRDLVDGLVAHALPDHDVVLRCLDKPTLLAAAADVGLAAPESRMVEGPGDLVGVAEDLGYPVVLKPQRSVVDEGGSWGQRTVRLVGDSDALVHEAAAFAFPLTLQRAWPGATVLSLGGIVDGGELVAIAYARYVRTWPAAAGCAAFAETAVLPPDLRDRAVELLRNLEWRGIFELELLEDPSGAVGAIDFNPRLYGSLTLARAAGVNLPAIWCDRLQRVFDPPAVARPGVRYRFEEADVRHAAWLVRHGRPAAAGRVLLPRRHTVHAVGELTDPLPLLARPLSLAVRFAGRYRRSRSKSGSVRSTTDRHE